MPASILVFPEALGGVVLTYNIPGLTDTLNLTATVIAKIFQGSITTWNHAEIIASNPNLKATANIVVAVRSDSSGSTYAFTDYLSNAAPAIWTSGKSALPSWSASFQKGNGNNGVTTIIQTNNYAIGYVQYGFAKLVGLPVASIQNKNGKWISVSDAAIQASTVGVALPNSDQAWDNLSIVNQAGDNVYPISTFTYMVVYQDQTQQQADVAGALAAYIRYILSEVGQRQCALNYLVALPTSIRQKYYQSSNLLTLPSSANPNTFLPPISVKLASVFTNSLYAAELTAAYKIACEAANKTFSTTSVSMQCVTATDATSAISAGANGVVGDVSSQDTLTEAVALGAAKIPQISPSASSVNLTIANYPYLLRTIPSDTMQSKALTSLVMSYGWNYTAIIASSSIYAQSIATSLITEQASKGLFVLTVQTFAAGETNPDNLGAQIGEIAGSGATIILVCASGNEVATVMQAAQQNHLTGAGFAWLSIDPSNIASSNLSSVQGLVALNPKSGTGLLYESLKITWATKDPVQYPGQVHSITQGSIPEPCTYSAQTFDAVYSFARGIDNLVNIGGDPTNGDSLLAAVLAVNFTGTTGPVAFTSTGEPFYPTYSVVNVLGSRSQYVGTVVPSGSFSLENVIVWTGGVTATPNGQRNLIFNLGGVFPTNAALLSSNPILYDLGIELQTAYRIACEVVNTQKFRFKFNCLWQPTAFDRNSTVIAAQKLVNSSVVGVVGSVYSETSEALAQYAKSVSLPQISPSASALLLSNKTAYPYFLRISPTEKSQVIAVAKLFETFSWKQVATFGVGSSYFQNTVSLFINECQSRSISVLTSQSLSGVQDRGQVSASLQAIKDSGARIIFLNAFIQDALVIFEEAAKLGMTEKGWGWIGSPQTTLLTRQAFSDHSAARDAMYGMVSIRPTGGVGAIYDFLISEWKSRDPVQYPGLLQQGYSEPITWSPETFDAVFAFAYAIDALLSQNGDPTNGTELMRALYKVNFTGATGQDSFDVNGDPFKPAFDVVNFRDGIFNSVGQYAVDGNNTFTKSAVIVWPGGQLEPPTDRYIPPPPPEVPKPKTISTQLPWVTLTYLDSLPNAVVFLIVLLAFVAVFALFALLFIWRKEKVTGHSFFSRGNTQTQSNEQRTELVTLETQNTA